MIWKCHYIVCRSVCSVESGFHWSQLLWFFFSEETGRLMARYCIAFETMKNFNNVQGAETLDDLVSDSGSRYNVFLGEYQTRIQHSFLINKNSICKNIYSCTESRISEDLCVGIKLRTYNILLTGSPFWQTTFLIWENFVLWWEEGLTAFMVLRLVFSLERVSFQWSTI